jgi:hypothetical protein
MNYDGDAISEQEWGVMDDEADYGNDFVESKVRTKKLHCSSCKKPINQGDMAIFELEHGQFRGVHCLICFHADTSMQVSMFDQRHPMDLEE